jgi:hypothetical protein
VRGLQSAIGKSVGFSYKPWKRLPGVARKRNVLRSSSMAPEPPPLSRTASARRCGGPSTRLPSMVSTYGFAVPRPPVRRAASDRRERGRRDRAALMLIGLYNYYAVPTNFRALNAFYYHVLWIWLRCLRRRSQRHRLTWRKMMRIAERWLPSPKLRHPYPDWRFDVLTRGGSPVR